MDDHIEIAQVHSGSRAEPVIAASAGKITSANEAAAILLAGHADPGRLSGLDLEQFWIPQLPPSMAPQRLVIRCWNGATCHVHVEAWASHGSLPGDVVLRLVPVPRSGLAQAKPLDWARAALEQSADGIEIVDRLSLRLLDLNVTAAKRMGRSRDELLGTSPWSHMEGGTQASYEALFDEVIKAFPRTLASEQRYRLPDGTPRDAEVLRTALRIQDSWLMVVSTRDITDQKKQQSRSTLLTRAFELDNDLMLIVDRESMHLVDCNEAACRYHGMTRHDLLQLPPWTLWSDGRTREELERRYDDAIAASPLPRRHLVPAARSRAGAHAMLEIQKQAIRMEDRWMLVITAREVPERPPQEARMERMGRALDMSGDAIVLIDRAGMRYIDANNSACALLGYARDELLASPLTEAGPRFGSLEELAAACDEAIARSPATIAFQMDFRRQDGTMIACDARWQAIRSEEGQWIIVATLRDIRDLGRGEEAVRQKVAELTRSNDELKQFAYVTSHDLFEPLRMMSSYSELLRRRYGDRLDSDGRDFIEFIAGGAERMKRLIDDLLLYSRAGRPSVPMKQLRLDDVLDDALANLAHAIERSGAVIERGPLPELTGESSGLTQVFQNLIGNSIKFTSPGTSPWVRVSASEDEANWIISVRDNGIGIAPEYFERVFVIFQRLRTQEHYEGTGVGLTICKKVIERHRGRILVDSSPGHGSTFTVHLPKTAA